MQRYRNFNHPRNIYV